MIGLSSPRREPEPFPAAELRAAAWAVRESMLGALEKDEDPEYAFSGTFLNRMQVLFRLDRRRTAGRRILQRAAVLLLALLLSGALFLAVNPDARAAFFGWVRTVYERSVVYEFFYDEPDAQDETESERV